MDIETIYSIGGAATNISYVLILVILATSGAYKQYRAFTGFIFFMALWGYADYLMGQTEEYIFIWRQYNFCNIFNAFLFYLFSNEFTKKYNTKALFISGGLCCFFLFTNYYKNLLIPDSVIELTGVELMKAIPLYNLFVIYYCTMLIMGTYWIYRHYHENTMIRRLILTSCIFTIIGDTYSYGTVYFEFLYNQPYLAYLICILPYNITYLILRHRLFDARSAVLHLLRILFIVGSSVIAVIVGYWFLAIYLDRTVLFNIDEILLAVVFMFLMIGLSRSHFVRSRFQISDILKLEKSIQEFLLESSVYSSQESLEKDILQRLQAGLKITSIGLIEIKDTSKLPHLKKLFEQSPKKRSKLITYKEAMQDNHKAAYTTELKKIGELCIPLYFDDTLSYFLTLPEKNSQSPYTNNEKNVLMTMIPKISLSLQILEYNKKLQEEVDIQTAQINEQKRELAISYNKLEALDKEKDIFMNMAAHELRTPMTIIHGYADIMLDKSSGELNPVQKKLVENILKGSDSLIALVNDLLNLSRIDAGKMELAYAPCSIQSIAHDVSDNFVTLMQNKKIHFTTEDTTDPQKILTTDKEKLILVFNNLLSNAYKYTPENGTVYLKITTINEKGVPWLQFSVTDTGIGIPKDEISHVFDRFANISTHDNIKSTIQSTGLGLSIVKKIVTGLHGDIAVTSVVDKGSTFTVKIPYTHELKK